jgi:small subunit ribosomal protein S8
MSPIANMLIQIKNAQSAGLESIAVPFSKMKLKIAEILKNRGYLEEVESKKRKALRKEVPFLAIRLKYTDGVGVINGIKFISKPSRRMYAGKDDLRQVRSGFGFSVISTPNGIMTGDEAKKAGVGGEMLFEIW